MVDRSGEVRKRSIVPGSSSSGTCVSFVNNSWRLWSEHTAESLEHRDKDQAYTAVCWVANAKQGQQDEELLVVGCKSGRVQVWNPRSGQVVGPVGLAFENVAQGVDSSVDALAAAPRHRSSVFAACRNWPDILEVGLYDGSTRSSFKADKVGVAFVACTVMKPTWVVSAGSSSTLKVWKYASASDLIPAIHCKFTGPANTLSFVDVTSIDSSIVALSCDVSSQVDVFVADATQASHGKAMAARYILSSHHAVHYASFTSSSGHEALHGQVCVVGYGPSGALLWQFKLEEGLTSAKTMHPILSVAYTSLGARVLYARYARPPAEVAEASASMVLGVGNLGHPYFTQVTLQGRGQHSKLILTKLGKPSVPKQREPAGAAAASSEPLRVLGHGDTTALRAKKRAADDLQADARKVPRKNLAEVLPKRAKVASALSAAPLARQALLAGDGTSVQQVIAIGDENVIDATVADLSASEALLLLKAITKKLVSEPSEATKFGNWISRILCRHMTALSQNPDFRGVAEPLQDVLRSRTSSWRAWARVRGNLRLYNLLVTQPNRMSKPEAEERRKPLLEYTEGDEEIEADDQMSDDAQEDDGQDDDDDEGEEEDLSLFEEDEV
mmetsp:Transcript_65826/g.122800  ORF Transcript_65826/g.122800 Transcript_65826/m.122800 type:complete len:614 (-) Transcript_65826:16-1857(-)